MKLRRALVTAAATAAVAPLALLSAPAAFAEEAPQPAATTATGTPDPAAAAQGTDPGTTAPGADKDPAAATGKDPDTAPPADPNANTNGKPAPADPDGGPKTPPAPVPDDPEKTGDPKPGADEEPGRDDCTAVEDSPGTLAELRGLPSKVVAGSGWHDFTFRVSNKTSEEFEATFVQLYAFAYAYDEDTTEITKYVRVQYSDMDGWHDVDTAIGEDNLDPFTDLGRIAPGDHADLPLRLSVDRGAPTGIGGSVAFATSVNADGVCGDSVPEDQEYRFEIVAAPKKPRPVPAAVTSPKPVATSTPTPSHTPAPQASSTPYTGELAATGSSSALPALGTAGGFAVLAGAGVVYAVRRRKVGDEA
ncbi:LPXTG cell wall anchor domain-containing protein [Streptomyces sp. NPDC046939]|uniref:LPXTG cell wall anchor domain-containing protein n=1 Tax=Streptomyces sp. NPDC046939 TaxID=3155376 RepID=UPI0033E5FDA6